ncbi:hypothetical protein FRC07_005838, partial [Ceratobasidium sp. 392]
MATTSLPDDLLLIMQSYIDPIPQHTISPRAAGPSRSVQEVPELAEGAEDEWSEGEDEVEATILVEKDDEAATEHSNPS